MSSPIVAVDREIVEHSFREWQQEQLLLDAQLAESVAALDAYQSNLDNWQQELVREREELRHLREAFARDQSGVGASDEQLDQLNKDLDVSRERIASLTSALLARTDELRGLEHQRVSANAELTLARVREQELTAQLAAQQHSIESERQQWEKQITHEHDLIGRAVEHAATNHHGESVRNSPVKPEPRRAASPVLGSVMEQFGKLREQRSMSRPSPKTR
jgi:septal ring factor EnvC (AmiA/AmiB activator)